MPSFPRLFTRLNLSVLLALVALVIVMLTLGRLPNVEAHTPFASSPARRARPHTTIEMGQAMKTRLFTVFVLAGGLTLLLTWTVAAHATKMKTDVQSVPHLVAANRIEPRPNHHHAANLGYTSNITFSPVFTIYLPLMQRILPRCATAPTLISPTHGSLLNTLIPVLTYLKGTARVSYTSSIIADNPAFNNPLESILYSGELGPFQHKLYHNLRPATVYYWRVQDVCGSVYSPHSPVFSFTTGSGGVILPAPVLASPVSGTLGLGQQVTLTWNSVAGAFGYRVWPRRIGSGTGALYFTSVNSQVVGYLEPHTTYEWNVNAYNDYAYGDWSGIWQFSTGPPALSQVAREADRVYVTAIDEYLFVKFRNGAPVQVYSAIQIPDSGALIEQAGLVPIEMPSQRGRSVRFGEHHVSPDGEYDVSFDGEALAIKRKSANTLVVQVRIEDVHDKSVGTFDRRLDILGWTDDGKHIIFLVETVFRNQKSLTQILALSIP